MDRRTNGHQGAQLQYMRNATGFHITGCPGQPFLPVGQPKVDSWLPDRATKSFARCIYIYVVGQPECLVGQSPLDNGCPTGQPVFKTNVKPWTYIKIKIERRSFVVVVSTKNGTARRTDGQGKNFSQAGHNKHLKKYQHDQNPIKISKFYITLKIFRKRKYLPDNRKVWVHPQRT